MSTPAAGTPQDSNQQEPSRREHKRPTVWIVLTAILGIAVIGLLIWAIVTRSDLDNANATIEAQRQTAEQASATAKKAYDDVSSDLAAAEEDGAHLQGDVAQADKEKASADTEAAKAKNETDKAKAEADQANAKADAATSCAKGTVNAFGAIFDGPTLKDGVEKATKQLQDLKGSCGPALKSG
jgi:chromosome segregation ATPase